MIRSLRMPMRRNLLALTWMLAFAAGPTAGFAQSSVSAAANSPAAEESDFGFVVEAEGGHLDRHRMVIPPGATGVKVTCVVLETFKNERWNSAASFGLGPKRPEDFPLFARLSFNTKLNQHQVKVSIRAGDDRLPTRASVEPGSTLVWEAEWTGGRAKLRLNGEEIATNVADVPAELVVISVSGLKLRVDDVAYATEGGSK